MIPPRLFAIVKKSKLSSYTKHLKLYTVRKCPVLQPLVPSLYATFDLIYEHWELLLVFENTTVVNS